MAGTVCVVCASSRYIIIQRVRKNATVRTTEETLLSYVKMILQHIYLQLFIFVYFYMFTFF